MSKKSVISVLFTGTLCISVIAAPVFIYADTDSVGPGGKVEVEEGGDVEYDTGEGQKSDNIHVDESEDTSDDTTESDANGSTNQTYEDDRTQDEKELNQYYVMLRDLVASWKNKCNGETVLVGNGENSNNLTNIRYGHLDESDIEQAKEYLDTFNDLKQNGDVDEYWSSYYNGFDFRDSSSCYAPTSDPAVDGVESLKSDELERIMSRIADENSLSRINSIQNDTFPSTTPSISSFSPLILGSYGLGITDPDYVKGMQIRTDMIPGGLNNASTGSWFQDIESMYRYMNLDIPESKTGSHGKFRSNAMNDFCSIALIRNYKVQEVTKETETIGEPLSDDYQIHLFSEDENGNRTEIEVLNTNQRINTIHLSDYPDEKKIIAQTYRKFNLTTYTRAAYAEYEYLIDVGTNNILWYSEHSMESSNVGKTGCRTVTTDVVSGISDWVADPDEAEIIIRDLSELTENNTVTERVD